MAKLSAMFYRESSWCLLLLLHPVSVLSEDSDTFSACWVTLVFPLSTEPWATESLTCVRDLFACVYTRGTQGDGRKCLDHFKSYLGSQISSQSLKVFHIYILQPKSATIVVVFLIFFYFSIYFCLWLFRVGVTDCKWRMRPTKCF